MKTVLLTGATSGIGLALARQLAQRGYGVIACGRNADALAVLAEELGESIQTLNFDITDRESVTQALGPVEQVDIAILNAGTCEYVDVEHFDGRMFQQVMASNFMGAVYCTEQLLPKMKKGQTLVYMDSLARMLPFTRSQAYGASKAALHYFAKSLAVDLKPRGIRVLTISPGFVDTPLTRRNTFNMPMRISAEQAALRIIIGIQKNNASIYFPTVFATLIRLTSLLPERVQGWLCEKMKG